MLAKITRLIIFGFGVGHLPYFPGTWGTIVGMAIFIPSIHFNIYFAVLLWFLLAIFTWREIEKVELSYGKDAPQIVIDEILGVAIPLFLFNDSALSLLSVFILFRLFDIAKPLMINRIQKFEGTPGVIGDDILAGIYTTLVMFTLSYFGILAWPQ